jgi:hypothetical protein
LACGRWGERAACLFNDAVKKGEICPMLWIAAEFSRLSDILEIMFIDHDRNHIGIDTECFYKSIGEFLYYGAFLFRGKSFSHLDNDYGHGYTFSSGYSGERE